MQIPTTIVINAAGTGTRLGMGLPKSLIRIHGRPLIHWQLDLLREVNDLRIVVGFQASLLIEAIREVRRDALIVFNHDFHQTNTAYSLFLGARFTDNDVLSLDGDLLIRKEDLNAFLTQPSSAIGIAEVTSEQPVFVHLNEEGWATRFSRIDGNAEWTGLVKIDAKRITPHKNYVYEMLEPYLPLPTIRTICCEIDTPNDYNRAAEWVTRYLCD